MKWLIFLLPFSPLFSMEGLEYSCLEIPVSYFNFIKKSVHVITVDPSLYEIKPVKALDNGVGRESVLSISTRHRAIASINGGFFAIGGLFDGQARGALKIHDWYALPQKPRGCIGWSAKDQIPKIDRLWISFSAKIGSNIIPIDGLNRRREEGEIILFTPCFHKTTLTHPDGEEIIISQENIKKTIRGGSSKIPNNGYVLSLQKKHPLFGACTPNTPISLSIKIESLIKKDPSDDWNSLDYIVGGTPILLHNGIRITDFKSEEALSSFLTQKCARTAIGILPDGKWVFVVVDKKGFFDGMNIDELSKFMESLGCLYALNLDGGGSSTMVYEGIVKNTYYGDLDEAIGQTNSRLVSDAILILPKNR